MITNVLHGSGAISIKKTVSVTVLALFTVDLIRSDHDQHIVIVIAKKYPKLHFFFRLVKMSQSVIVSTGWSPVVQVWYMIQTAQSYIKENTIWLHLNLYDFVPTIFKFKRKLLPYSEKLLPVKNSSKHWNRIILRCYCEMMQCTDCKIYIQTNTTTISIAKSMSTQKHEL